MPEDKKQEEVKKPSEVEPKAKEAPPPKSKLKVLLTGLIIAVIILAGGCGVLAWQFWDKYDANKQKANQISDLQKELTELKEASASPTSTPTPTPTPAVSTTTLTENIEAALNTMNTSALTGYMADSVYVVLAASEYAHNGTSAEAVLDLNYLSSATPPWDFSLPAATLAAYDAGFYTDYFNADSIVGQSSDDYVVVFNVNSDNEINGIFICASADLLL